MKTISHRFRLKSQDPDTPGGIMYLCHIKKPFQYGLGERFTIAPRLWDAKTKRPTNDKTLIREFKAHYPNIENHLRNIQIRIENLCREVESFVSNSELHREQVDLNALKQHLNDVLKQTSRNNGNEIKRGKFEVNSTFLTNSAYVLDYAESFVKDIINAHRSISSGNKTSVNYKDGTIKNYKNFLSRWKDFETAQKKRFSWNDLDKLVYDRFIQFLNDSDYSKNYAGRLVKHLKVIAQAAFDDKVHKNKVYRESWFKTLTAPVKNICLSSEELSLMENIDLSNRPAWDKARDLFLVGCYTALRFSDIKRLTKGHIHGKQIIIPAQKTQREVTIPLHPNLLPIFKKHNGHLPSLPAQKVNEYIKEIAKLAGIDSKVERSETRGGDEQIRQYLKFELITTHTARRTCATLLYFHPVKRMEPMDIMALTGHKSLSSFQKYICTGTNEQTLRIAEHPMFN